jgi:GrpB-like predicted nucleotidyltransferase (UPF0157 family)
VEGAPIALSPYDPRWAVLFEQERISLEAALTEWLAGPVEHIGSTSVARPGSKADHRHDGTGPQPA